MFIQTEATPNPATLKFLPGRSVMPEGTLDIRDPRAAGRSPLARRLFAVDGVTGVFYGSDFVTVTKRDGDWQHLKPAVLGAIMEHFLSGDALFDDASAAATPAPPIVSAWRCASPSSAAAMCAGSARSGGVRSSSAGAPGSRAHAPASFRAISVYPTSSRVWTGRGRG